jgi:nucleoside-diphosphate-sugar epimerase
MRGVMKVLFIGGTGIISAAVSRLAVKRGLNLYLFNRGKRNISIDGTHVIQGDINNQQEIIKLLKDQKFDCVVNWINFNPEHIERDLMLFKGKTEQYIFISSASVYQKPPLHPVITESTPLYNPFWDYSQNKILCEERLIRAYREEDFPITIVRPSLTYDKNFPIAVGGWGCFTLADRMLNGKKVIVHGDGTSLWTVTHADDFARGFIGLIGHQQVIGHSFHITSDEILTWNQIYATMAHALGVKANIIHIPSDFIHRIAPEIGTGLLGDKAYSTIFDNSKIKRYVPGFQATIPFKEGMKRTVTWFNEEEKRKYVNDQVNRLMDKIIENYEKCLL